MKKAHLLITFCIPFAMIWVSACSSKINLEESESTQEEIQEDTYKNAQEFKGEKTKIDLYLLSVKRITPDSVKVEFDLVNNSYGNRYIQMREGDSFYKANNYLEIDGKQMSLEKIYVNGWIEHKRDFQHREDKKISFITPDEWQPSMKQGQTYNCYFIYSVPEDATYINNLGINYNGEQINIEAIYI